MDGDPTTYERLLRKAYDLGREDGRAAPCPDLDDAAAGGPTCHGLGPDELAAWLWERQPRRPPAGLPLNGPLWYAAGFRAGLAEQIAGAAVPKPRTASTADATAPVD